MNGRIRIARKIYKQVPISVRRLVWRGSRRHCPVCRGRVRRFLAQPVVKRPDALCPVCGSLERQRFAWVFFQQKTDLFDTLHKSMLHIAPEPCLERELKKVPRLDYLTSDLYDDRAMVKMDITSIPRPGDTFDVIYCSHVLQYLADDHKALAEFHRVLKPGGWAALVVPITARETGRDLSDRSEMIAGRIAPARPYGLDFQARTEKAGFRTQVFQPLHILSDRDRQLMSIPDSEVLFYCRKPAPPTSTVPTDSPESTAPPAS